MTAYTVTWLGEGGDGPDSTEVFARPDKPLRLDKGVGITIDPAKEANSHRRQLLEHFIKKAGGNVFFKVEEKRGPGRPPGS